MIDYKSSFPLGAKVVGVVSLILSIYITLVSSLFLGLRYTVLQDYCDIISSRAEGDNKQTFLENCTFYAEYTVYVTIGILVYGLSLFVISVMLLAGVAQNSTCLMVPYLIWSGIQIISVLILIIVVSALVLTGEFMAAAIVSTLLFFIIPFYFWIVVYKHRSEAIKVNFLKSVSPVTPINGNQQQYPFRKDFQNGRQDANGSVTQPTSPLFSRRNSDEKS